TLAIELVRPVFDVRFQLSEESDEVFGIEDENRVDFRLARANPGGVLELRVVVVFASPAWPTSMLSIGPPWEAVSLRVGPIALRRSGRDGASFRPEKGSDSEGQKHSSLEDLALMAVPYSDKRTGEQVF
ncbi:hypothetical protein WDZ92_34635, partial [Nostoc sp. NIES-2111]